jgi:hypothetical protein
MGVALLEHGNKVRRTLVPVGATQVCTTGKVHHHIVFDERPLATQPVEVLIEAMDIDLELFGEEAQALR